MASSGARFLLLGRRPLQLHAQLQARNPALPKWQHPHQLEQQRQYIFLPSDWSELVYRFRLFWESHKMSPTKIRLRYKSQKSKLKANYQFQKMRLQRRYRLNKDYIQRRRSQFQQRRSEFTKRWTARRKEVLQDTSQMVTRIFTLQEYAKPHWFDQDGRPLASRDPTGRFVNPWLSWSTNGVHSITNILKWRYQRAIRQWKERGILSYLPKDMTQLLFGSALSNTNTNNSNNNTALPPTPDLKPTEIQFTWIGHSTCLVQMGNATILTDPIFSHRCTPFPRMPGVGVARDVPPSMTIQQLPKSIDVCLISHDHYDHLDRLTIDALKDRVQHWVLPKGLPQWLETRCSVSPNDMTELEWWESVQFQQDSDGKWQINNKETQLDQQSNSMTITCCPAQHWSSRTFFDRCKRLWCGFAVETTTFDSAVQKFYFAGDTGMPRNQFPLFPQIADFCGRALYRNKVDHKQDESNETTTTTTTFHPFDLAAIPIGAYDPSFLMQDAHMDPAEAVQCARQLQARKAVAIHWGTFALSEEPLHEPPQKLKEALERPENKEVDFVTLPIGGSLTVPSIGSDMAQEETEQQETASEAEDPSQATRLAVAD